MIKFHKIFASVLDTGQLEDGGTIAAIVYCIDWNLLPKNLEKSNWIFFSTLIIIGMGIWSANEVDAIWGKDSGKVVIDEVAGMAITLLLVPKNINLFINCFNCI